MPANASIQLGEIAARLKATGQRGLRLEMGRGIRAGVALGIPAVRQAARRQLPKSGGLAEYEATQKIGTRILSGTRTAGVRVVGKASVTTNTGTWRHPTPALLGYDRSYWKWVDQTYGPAAGWWSDTWRRQARTVTPLIVTELNATARRIQETS